MRESEKYFRRCKISNLVNVMVSNYDIFIEFIEVMLVNKKSNVALAGVAQ